MVAADEEVAAVLEGGAAAVASKPTSSGRRRWRSDFATELAAAKETRLPSGGERKGID